MSQMLAFQLIYEILGVSVKKSRNVPSILIGPASGPNSSDVNDFPDSDWSKLGHLSDKGQGSRPEHGPIRALHLCNY